MANDHLMASTMLTTSDFPLTLQTLEKAFFDATVDVFLMLLMSRLDR
jgi:hypothetical protein